MLDYDRLHNDIAELRCKQIFFIAGTVKSGTTWLQLLLDAHPQISCRGEGHFLDVLAPALREAIGRHGDLLKRAHSSIFHEVAEYPRLAEEQVLYLIGSTIAAFLLEQSRGKAARAVGEKNPMNVAHLAMLLTLFPAAKFILVVRDGRDCAVSGWFDNIRVSGDQVRTAFGTLDSFAQSVAAHWAEAVTQAAQFVDRHPGCTRLVRYEDLVADTTGVLADLCGFLGVDAAAPVIAQCRDAAAFSKLTGGRSPGEEDRRSFFRKGLPGDWRGHLSPKAAAQFRVRAGAELLSRFGYQ